MIPGLYWALFGTQPGFGAALVALLVGPLAALLLYTVWVCYRYMPTITRVFEETPIFLPPCEPPYPDAATVRFQTWDGLWLRGSWLAARGEGRRGLVVFCHEYLSDRWSCRPYCEPLLANGYDVFTFDFRNHGESDSLAGYQPMQWASDHEVADLHAALAYVRSRAAETDPRIGLLGISRGGSVAILAAPDESCVQSVVTDGAFPTHLTQLNYMMRWAGIYVGKARIYQLTPGWYYSLICGVARQLAARRHRCRFPRVESAIRRLSPRRLLMIHGQKDSYIVPDIARQLYEYAREPKELWIVPDAKHNGAIQVAGALYGQRLLDFFGSDGAVSHKEV